MFVSFDNDPLSQIHISDVPVTAIDGPRLAGFAFLSLLAALGVTNAMWASARRLHATVEQRTLSYMQHFSLFTQLASLSSCLVK
jgi:hypothetical protein